MLTCAFLDLDAKALAKRSEFLAQLVDVDPMGPQSFTDKFATDGDNLTKCRMGIFGTAKLVGERVTE